MEAVVSFAALAEGKREPVVDLAQFAELAELAEGKMGGWWR